MKTYSDNVNQKLCTHLSEITDVKVSEKRVCEECVKSNSGWVHLRTCQTCGVTLCCNSSPNRHMAEHYHATQHPVASSAEPGERWMWCYVDEQLAEY